MMMLTCLLALAFCLPQASFAAGKVGVSASEEDHVFRFAGEDRFATSVAAAFEIYPVTERVILVSNSNDFADGLAASVLAGAVDAPILLTQPGQVPDVVADYLASAEVKEIYLIGGPQAISAQVEKTLKQQYQVERIAGETREATAVQIAKKAKQLAPDYFEEVALIVNGRAPADALVAGPLAGQGMPLLMVNKDSIPQVTLKGLQELGVKAAFVVGGEAVVSDAVLGQLNNLLPGTTVNGVKMKAMQIGGDNRMETSLYLAELLPAADVLLVGWEGLADAVSAGYVGSLLGAPILYTHAGKLDEEVGLYLEAVLYEDSTVTIFGGEKAVSSEVEAEVKAIFAALLEQQPTDPSTGQE